MSRTVFRFRCTPRIDLLEVRDCPTVLVIPDPSTMTLRVYGDKTDNAIAVVDNGVDGISITGDGVAFPTYKGFQNVAVGTGDGNDVILYRSGAGGGSAGQHKIDMNLGGGNDKLNYVLIPLTNSSEYRGPGSVIVKVDGSVGDDTLNFTEGTSDGNPFNAVLTAEVKLDVTGGAGNDTLTNMLAGVGVRSAVSLNFLGGDGADTIAQDFHKIITYKNLTDTVRGGSGNDRIDVNVVDGVYNAPVAMSVLGDAGNDTIHYSVGSQLPPPELPPPEGTWPANPVVNRTFNFLIDGGVGNDTAAANVSVARGAGSMSGRVLGGEGDDQLALNFNFLPPTFMSVGSIDGGAGLDIAHHKGNVTVLNCEG